MNSKEKFISALELEEPDSVPLAPLISLQYVPKACGVKHTRFIYGENSFRASCYVKASDRFDTDWIYTGFGRPTEKHRRYRVTWSGGYVHIHDLVVDKVTKLPEDGYPYEMIERADYKYKDDPDLRGYMNDFEARPGTYANIMDEIVLDKGSLEQIDKIVKAAGDIKFIIFHMVGACYPAFTRLGSRYFLSYYREPERLKGLMDLITKNQEDVIDRVAATGIDGIILGDGMCGSDSLSREFYVKFAQPFHRRLIERIRRRGLYSVYWFWGGVMDRLEEIADVNPHCLWVEESMREYVHDLAQIKATLEGRVCVMGNVDGRELLKGRAEVAAEIKRCLREGAPGGGYIFSTGRPVSEDVPLRNVSYLCKTLRRIGKYPS